MGFFHRELFRHQNYVNKEGYDKGFKLSNKTVNAFMAVDGFSIDLDMEDEIDIRLCDHNSNLSTILFDN